MALIRCFAVWKIAGYTVNNGEVHGSLWVELGSLLASRVVRGRDVVGFWACQKVLYIRREGVTRCPSGVGGEGSQIRGEGPADLNPQ